MIAWRDALLMPVAEGLSSQPIRRDSVVAVAARSRLNVRMPGAAQVAAGQSSVGTRPQMLAVALNALERNVMTHPGLVDFSSSLCGVEQAALVASDITLRDAVFVLLRVSAGRKSECSSKAQRNQAADNDPSQRAFVFAWLVHQSIPTITTSPGLI